LRNLTYLIELRELIVAYEKKHWSDVEKITDEQIALHDEMKKIALSLHWQKAN